MHKQPHIHLYNLCYSLPHTQVNLVNVTRSFSQEKIGIVGDNGVGKSTLLRLLTGELTPLSGSIQVVGNLSYSPQHYQTQTGETVADILDVTVVLRAHQRILNGSTDTEDYETLGNDWDIQERLNKLFAEFDLATITLNQAFTDLSGGQQTKLLLLRSFSQQADFILLDEPTNNLDILAREKLYAKVNETKAGLLIVSHDRELLGQMDKILEITSLGVAIYGGNYAHFEAQKTLENAALESRLQDTKKALKKTVTSIAQTKEKHAARQTQGKKIRKSGSQSKLLLDAKKNSSENTQSSIAKKAVRMQESAQIEIAQVKGKIELKREIDVSLNPTFVPSSKQVLFIENLSFKFPNQDKYFFKNFNLSVSGPERIALIGPNGTGKSTLFKLIMKEIEAETGVIAMGINQYNYLDQSHTLLDPNKTIIENFLVNNPDTPMTKAYRSLAQFMFRNADAEKQVANLSGGEKIRASLACVLLSKQPPQLLLLDEPTNHLDIQSLESIESILQSYEGAMIVSSHDESFLEKIKITRTLKTTEFILKTDEF